MNKYNDGTVVYTIGDIEKLTAERDAALAREAELVAQVEVLRIAALNAIQRMSGGEAKADLRDAYDAAPTQCLRIIQADAGRLGWLACVEYFGLVDIENGQYQKSDYDAANEYAERVKAGKA